MERTLTIFLCGTHRDLKDERNAVIAMIEQMKAEHDSMEFFGARPHPPLETCLEEVRKSDVLVVVVGHRYGDFVPERGVSYTEAEYTEGFARDKPCLVYFRDRSVPVLADDFEQNPQGMEALARFRARLEERHTVATFRGPEDLAEKVETDLERLFAARVTSVEETRGVYEVVLELVGKALDAGVTEATLLTTVRGAIGELLPQDNRRSARVFLSYAAADREIVGRVESGLRARGVDVWWDEGKVLPGDDIIQLMANGLEHADVVALFVSAGFVGRRFMQIELNYAIAHRLAGGGGATVLPIRLDETPVPSILRDVREVDLRDGDVDRAIVQIMRLIPQLRAAAQPAG